MPPGAHRAPESYGQDADVPVWEKPERDEYSPRYRQKVRAIRPSDESPMQPGCWSYYHMLMTLAYFAYVR